MSQQALKAAKTKKRVLGLCETNTAVAKDNLEVIVDLYYIICVYHTFNTRLQTFWDIWMIWYSRSAFEATNYLRGHYLKRCSMQKDAKSSWGALHGRIR